MKILNMTALEKLKAERAIITNQLSTVELPYKEEASCCWSVGSSLGVSGPTIKNYLDGRVGDWLLAKHIYMEFKRLKLIKK